MSKWRMRVIDLEGYTTYEDIYPTKAAAIEDGYRAMEVDDRAERYEIEEIKEDE